MLPMNGIRYFCSSCGASIAVSVRLPVPISSRLSAGSETLSESLKISGLSSARRATLSSVKCEPLVVIQNSFPGSRFARHLDDVDRLRMDERLHVIAVRRETGSARLR